MIIEFARYALVTLWIVTLALVVVAMIGMWRYIFLAWEQRDSSVHWYKQGFAYIFLPSSAEHFTESGNVYRKKAQKWGAFVFLSSVVNLLVFIFAW